MPEAPKSPTAMTSQLEAADPDTELFTTLMMSESFDDVPSEPSDSWSSETKLHVLAYEIAAYRPDIARQLGRAGLARMTA